MPLRLFLAALFLTVLLCGGAKKAAAAKKKDPDARTQVLALPQDPPAVATGATRRLLFQVSPLSAKGLLSQQTREAVKALLKSANGGQIIHIRAFVAGNGDLRRVPQIVSEVLSGKMPLPSVSVLQAGSLGLENAQVVLESVVEGKRDVNPEGLEFFEAQPLEALAARLAARSSFSLTCFGAPDPRLAQRFPAAALTIVQPQRVPSSGAPVCEAIARGGPVTADRLAFTGTQTGFGAGPSVELKAFQRLDRDLTGDIVATHLYPVDAATGEQLRKVRLTPGVFSVVPIEGVASADASFAADLVAIAK